MRVIVCSAILAALTHARGLFDTGVVLPSCHSVALMIGQGPNYGAAVSHALHRASHVSAAFVHGIMSKWLAYDIYFLIAGKCLQNSFIENKHNLAVFWTLIVVWTNTAI